MISIAQVNSTIEISDVTREHPNMNLINAREYIRLLDITTRAVKHLVIDIVDDAPVLVVEDADEETLAPDAIYMIGGNSKNVYKLYINTTAETENEPTLFVVEDESDDLNKAIHSLLYIKRISGDITTYYGIRVNSDGVLYVNALK